MTESLTAYYRLTADNEVVVSEVNPGDQITDFRGNVHTFKAVIRRPEPGLSGKVLTDKGQFYDKVFPGLVIE